MIIDPRRGDVGVPKPLLHLGDIGLVIERVGGSGRAQRMRADLKTERGRVGAHQLVNTVRRDRLVEPTGGVVANRPEQRAAIVLAVSGGFKIFMNERMSAGMQRHIAGLAAFAGHLEMRHAFACLPEIPNLELAQLVTPQRVEQQRRQDCAVALAAGAVVRGGRQQLARLVIAERRRLAFAGFCLRPLDAFDGVMGDRVPAAEIEKIVIDQVRLLLLSPEIIVQTWRNARKSIKGLIESDVRSALLAFDPLWNELFPTEQSRIISLLVERVDIRTDRVDIKLRIDGVTSLLGELKGNSITQQDAA